MNEVALVTGAAGALGSEVARTLHARGWRLALVDREAARPRLEELAASIAGAAIVAGDIAQRAVWAEALPRIDRELGAPPSAAALVAGGWKGGRALHEASDDEDDATWTAMMGGNLETTHRALRALLPAMVARRRGAIVVVGSRAAVDPASSARASAYAASKAATVALAQAVAAEVRADDVRVNAILPSTLDTPANRAAMPSADATRWVSLASAAAVIAFLVGDDSRDISGAAIPVYGKA